MSYYTDWTIPVPFDVWEDEASGDYFTVLSVERSQVTVMMGNGMGDQVVLPLDRFGKRYTLFSSPTKGIVPRRRPAE